MTEQEQRGPQALPASAQQITGNFGNRLEGRSALARKFLLDLEEVFANQLKYFLGSQ